MSKDEIPVKRGRGRPKGARNRASIDLAQDLFDDSAVFFANIVKELAGSDKTPATVRLAACKLGLGKSLADDKEKAAINGAIKGKAALEEDMPPQIHMSAAPE